jgi:hypothetical protein
MYSVCYSSMTPWGWLKISRNTYRAKLHYCNIAHNLVNKSTFRKVRRVAMYKKISRVTLKMEAAGLSETFVPCVRNTSERLLYWCRQWNLKQTNKRGVTPLLHETLQLRGMYVTTACFGMQHTRATAHCTACYAPCQRWLMSRFFHDSLI